MTSFVHLYLSFSSLVLLARFVVFCVTSLRKCSRCLKRHKWLLAVVTAAISFALFLENDTKMQNWREGLLRRKGSKLMYLYSNVRMLPQSWKRKRRYSTRWILKGSMHHCKRVKIRERNVHAFLTNCKKSMRRIGESKRGYRGKSNATMRTSTDNEKCTKRFAELNETIRNVSDMKEMLSKLNIDLESCMNNHNPIK